MSARLIPNTTRVESALNFYKRLFLTEPRPEPEPAADLAGQISLLLRVMTPRETRAYYAGVSSLRAAAGLRSCTTLDHVYPVSYGTVVPGSTCYCGQKVWGGANSALDAHLQSVVESLSSSQPISDPTTKGQSIMAEVKLQLKAVDKNGLARYGVEGVRSGVYFGKGMFVGGTAPQELTVVAPDGVEFAQPGAPTPAQAEKAAAKETRAKAAAEKAAAQLAKAQERAEKARVAAEKAAARVAKTGGAAAAETGAPAETPAEPVGAAQ